MLALWRWTIYCLLLCLGFWFVDPRWSGAEFVLTSSLLMSDSKTQAVIYYSGSFRLFSEALHYSTVPLLCCMILGAVRFRGGSMIQCCIFFFFFFFTLIVDSKWHLWDTLIKQFFLLLRPGRHFQQIFSFICIHFFFLFFSFRETRSSPFVIHSPEVDWDRKKCL